MCGLLVFFKSEAISFSFGLVAILILRSALKINGFWREMGREREREREREELIAKTNE